jgi:hypothetical protein
MYVKGTISEGVDWINLAGAGNKRHSVVKTFRFHEMDLLD